METRIKTTRHKKRPNYLVHAWSCSLQITNYSIFLCIMTCIMCVHLLLMHFGHIITPPYGVCIFHSNVSAWLIFLTFLNILCGNFAVMYFRFVSLILSILVAAYQNRWAIFGYDSAFILSSRLNIVGHVLSVYLIVAITSSASTGVFTTSPFFRNSALMLYFIVCTIFLLFLSR